MRHVALFGVSVALAACGPTSSATDGASGLDSGVQDGNAVRCAADHHCDDGAFCTTDRCRPDAPEADARGCVDIGSPCSTGICNEEADRCDGAPWCTDGRDGCLFPGDCDGDGARAGECGGSDCDDDDGGRFPGNPEICDAEGHDEDCIPDTVGTLDADGDGAISAACCNGTECGTDCDDSAREIAPGAAEICNGADDNCNGEVDEAGAFCPVGTCRDRRCRALSWERVYASERTTEISFSTSVDTAGNVYTLLQTSADLDGDGAPEPSGTYLLALGPEGRYRWHRSLPGSYQTPPISNPAGDMLIAPSLDASGRLQLEWLRTTDGTTARSALVPPSEGFVGGNIEGMSLFGDGLLLVLRRSQAGTPYVFIQHVDNGLSLVSEVRINVSGHAAGRTVAGVSDDGVAFVAGAAASQSIPGGTLPAGRFLARLTSDLELMWVHPLSLNVDTKSVAVADDGAMAFGGYHDWSFDPEWGEPWPAPGAGSGGGSFLVVLERDGGERWTTLHDGGGSITSSVSFDGRGNLISAGSFKGRMEIAPLGALTAPDSDGFFVAWSAGDGFPVFARQLGGTGVAIISQIAVDPFGGVAGSGSFYDTVTLVTGTEYTTADSASDGFVFRISDI